MQEIESRPKDPETGLLVDQGNLPLKPKHPFLDKISRVPSEIKAIALFTGIVIVVGGLVYTCRIGNTLKQFIKSGRLRNFE